MQDWLWMTAAELGQGIGAGAIDPVALTEAHLEAIAQHEHGPTTYARVTTDRARSEAAAAAARAKAGQRLSMLDGVPISWKDLFDSAGTATESGSALLAGRVPDHDAEVLRNARAAGLVCLGKTHMSELAFSGLGLNPITATPPCVNGDGAVPGGSSSGAATSVAYGLAAAAIGSDTGGSVRIPAAWNDLVGLKTTHGRVSTRGVVPLVASFDTVGPLTRTVEDAGLLLAALEGRKPADLRGATLQGRRFAVLKTVAMDDLRDAPGAAFQSALDRLRNAGALVETIEIPELAEAMDLSAVLFSPEAYATWKDVIEAAPDKMFPRILERFRSGASFDAPDVMAAWQKLHRCRAAWNRAVAGYDAVLTPTAANLPPDMERLLTDDAYYVTENLLTLRNTRIGNLMGGCGLTLPTGVPSCGLQMLAPPMNEARLLRLGVAAESALA
ncbi:amidase family protein [Marinovum sp. 2_MG-2023]|uniref:amidase n=1 Tax=unclassified Marinovum TaxID=2647166 RepID=UPI0026E18A39|nr:MULTISPECIES: amidase family protein [unclassified Marinovum]MDO6731522.1 amidase family protein [Marinovum sp. 2_MG-2023]MDO6780882.1 amidase family protein [Marinovum sp. 1_MG-2023]